MKKFAIVLLVLVLASSSVFAFQGWDLFGKGSSTESAETSEMAEKAASSKKAIKEVQADLNEKLSQSEAVSSENVQSETSNQLKNVVEEYSESSKLNRKQMEELMDKLNLVSDDIDLLIADNLAKDAALARMRFYANGGLVLGFRNAEKVVPTLGVTANGGVKFGNGITVGTGLQYMMVDFGKKDHKIDASWDISKLSITATCGYEW